MMKRVLGTATSVANSGKVDAKLSPVDKVNFMRRFAVMKDAPTMLRKEECVSSMVLRVLYSLKLPRSRGVLRRRVDR